MNKTNKNNYQLLIYNPKVYRLKKLLKFLNNKKKKNQE